MYKHIATCILAAILVAGCTKENNNGDVTAPVGEYFRVNCNVDLQDNAREGLSVMTFGSGAQLTSTSTTTPTTTVNTYTPQVYVLNTTLPQLLIVADDNTNAIRMLYRGVIENGKPVEINAHSTALAMVTCNPLVALVGDSNFSTMISIIEGLQSFSALETMVETHIATKRDLFDTTNNRLLQGVQTVLDELLGGQPDTTGGASYTNPMPWADFSPLRCQWSGSATSGRFSLSNYALVPTYYGTITDDNGRRENIVIPSVSRYSGGSSNLLWGSNDESFGRKVTISLSSGPDNNIQLTNLNDSRAVAEISKNLVTDLTKILLVNLPNNLMSEISTEAGEIVTNALSETRPRSDNAMRKKASSIGRNAYTRILELMTEYVTTEALQLPYKKYDKLWSERVVNITIGKIFAYYNAMGGGANLSMRIYCLMRYPNDISFCSHLERDGYAEMCHDDLFSISDTKKVRFAPGNVQYQASTQTWRFAEHQYDYIGNAPGNTSRAQVRDTQSYWIDLFCWGSGQYPTTLSRATGTPSFYDWGDNFTGDWRTLSYNEGSYLLNQRPGHEQKYGLGNINGINGLILLPDNWTLPRGLTFTAGHSNGYNTNTYSTSEWERMEDYGAVFLPATGVRNKQATSTSSPTVTEDGTSAGYLFNDLYYSGSAYAYYLYFSNSNVYCRYNTNSNNGSSLATGHPVRLVKDIR